MFFRYAEKNGRSSDDDRVLRLPSIAAPYTEDASERATVLLLFSSRQCAVRRYIAAGVAKCARSDAAR